MCLNQESLKYIFINKFSLFDEYLKRLLAVSSKVKKKIDAGNFLCGSIV
jgi:hypothetical protein